MTNIKHDSASHLKILSDLKIDRVATIKQVMAIDL